MAGRRQGSGRFVEVAPAQTKETTATQAAHAGGKSGQATGASRAAEAFNRTNEKRTTMMVARFDVFFFAWSDALGSCELLLLTTAATSGTDTGDTSTDAEQSEG
ncbi:hypothetical protein FF011L_05500 [Roseimaritima multifibrata]|uniref:Uncharacterized protein n=1 Tax=Roseimaritima multifibrata TaxID=1930274 RepID=A0A517MAA7_9BACT|nr:hypothetical protein FF011L_05500 [Roseimaritima multifibrata]